MVKQLAKRLVSPCIWKKENFLYNYFGHYVLLWQQKKLLSVESLIPRKKNLIKSDVVHTSYELKAYKSTSWNSKVLFQIHESQIQIHELRVLKSFGNSWGNSSVQFLVIILCFTFQLFHGYCLSRKQCEKVLTLKEEI